MSKGRIIIAEDDAIIALDTEIKLNERGYNVVSVVNNGDDCIRVASEYKPDVIIMDIGLKGEMDGIEAARHIHELLSIPIIYLTGNSDKKTLDRLNSAPKSLFLVKPLLDDRLFKALDKVLQ